MQPEVSVIMPVYNGGSFLKNAIESVLCQTISDFEFIIINDGSVDDTEDIILSFNDKRIVYVRNETNLRLIKTLNKGIDMAKGKYIARMDADDISLKNRFEVQLKLFNQPNVDIVNGRFFILDNNGEYFYKPKTQLSLSDEALSYIITLQNLICHPAVMVKSSLLRKYKYLDQPSIVHVEDFDLWNRMILDKHKCVTTDEPVLLYRDNFSSINHSNQEEQAYNINALKKRYLFERFRYRMPDEVILALSEKVLIPSDTSILLIRKELRNFIRILSISNSLSELCVRDLSRWVDFKVFLIVSKGFLKMNSFQKLEGLCFYFSHLRKCVRFALTIILQKKYSVNEINNH